MDILADLHRAEYGRSHDSANPLIYTLENALVFYNVFTRLDAEALTAKLTHWATLAFERFRPSVSRELPW